MRTTALVFAVLMLCSLPNVALAQAPVFINFDDLSAPCDLASAQPLRDEYAALGVEFQGHWSNEDGGAAVLGECSGYGIPGYSPPNFVVLDPQAVLETGGIPNELAFRFTFDAPRLVRVKVGGPPATTVYLFCIICPWASHRCIKSDEVVLDGLMRTLEVSVEGPSTFGMGCSVYSNEPEGTWIVDNLELHYELPQIHRSAPPAPPS